MFRFLLLLSLLPLPLMAQPPNLAELNALYEGLVAEEEAVLAQQARVQRNVDNPDLILLVETGGQIIGMTREELGGYFSGIIARMNTLGLTEAYLNRLTFWKRTIAEAAIANGALESAAIAKLAQRTIVLRVLEREKLPLIAQDLAQIRAQAAEIQRQREAARAWLARGDGSSFGDTPDLSVCRDPDIPADYSVSESSVGYGGSGGYAAKGNYICIWADSFYYMEGDVFARYYCDAETGLDCVRDDERSYRWEAYDDSNPAVLQAFRTGSSSLRFYAPEP